MLKLRDCAYCGSKADIYTGCNVRISVDCVTCNQNDVLSSNDKYKAIAFWNKCSSSAAKIKKYEACKHSSNCMHFKELE